MRLYCYAAPSEAEHVRGKLPGDVELLGLGVGKARATMTLTHRLSTRELPEHIVLFGVAGVLPERLGGTTRLAPRDACVVTHERFADEGLITGEGFRTLDDMGLGETGPWALDAALAAQARERLGLPGLPAMTVSTASGTDATAHAAAERGEAEVESMEGAAVAMVAATWGVPLLQLRTISNYTGARMHGGWDLKGATSRLGEHVLAFAAAAS